MLAWVVAAAALTLSCGDQEEPPPIEETVVGAGESCGGNVVCDEGLDCTQDELCQVPCDTDDDCYRSEVCEAAGTNAYCVEECEDDDDCPAPSVCDSSLGCVSPSGETCSDDDDCASRECRDSGVCGSEPGAACTAATCDRCLRLSSGRTLCSGDCSSDWECEGGTECTSSRGYCWPRCGVCSSCFWLEYFDGPAKSWCDDDAEVLVDLGAGGAPN